MSEMGGSGGEGAENTLAHLLPSAARRFGDQIALVGDERRWTFAEVHRSASAVAQLFRQSGLVRGDRVVVSMHKTPDSFVVIHALLSVGAVVVPIDPLMPMVAAEELVESIAPSGLVVDGSSLQRLTAPPAAALFCTEELPQADVAGSAKPNESGLDAVSLRDAIDHPPSEATTIESGVQPDDAAYVIFTSGSTGVPKGITHSHRSARAYAELAVRVHGIAEDDCIAGLPPLHFDMSTLELYAAPLAGASIVPIGTAELRFPANFTDRAQREQITIWYSVPFQLRLISERGAVDQRDLSALRHVIYAGEAFSAPALGALMRQLPGVRFSNAYGPAETNVVTVHEIPAPPSEAVPIGRPWGDVEIRIVEAAAEVTSINDLAEVEVGELGELWVAAESMMVGYLDRPDLDRERLVSDGERRWYRTGDLVRADVDGVLHLAGRVDHQVKVRGTRIELEAVEAVLASNDQVAEAVVSADQPGSSIDHLVAAVTLAPGISALDIRSLRRWCVSRLTSVAVPLDVDVWPDFPLTSSGKVDRSQVRTALRDGPVCTRDEAGESGQTNGEGYV